MHFIGRIDIGIYSSITEDIITDEVIITEERIAHIKERHPNDYERYAGYLSLAIEKPDYIIEDDKPNTVIVLKEIRDANEFFIIVLRIVIPKDPDGYKNSIITFLKTDSKRYARYLRTKKILYKKE